MIFHITTEKEWNDCLSKPDYAPVAYFHEGFIHACRENQIAGVLHRYFKGQKNLVLLYIEEEKLQHPVKNEYSTGRELFPHIYGTINKDAIVRTEKVNTNF